MYVTCTRLITAYRLFLRRFTKATAPLSES